MFIACSRHLRLLPALCLALPCGCLALAAQVRSSNVIGYWQEPAGSVIEILPCGTELCARLAMLSRTVTATTDSHDPDPALRSRALCGLTIGTGFHPEGPASAKDGKLYDPKSGKTYSGEMRSAGDTLHLRGYVGARIFGRTEVWKRTAAPAARCPG